MSDPRSRLCPACQARWDQAQAEGKIGVVLCETCAAASRAEAEQQFLTGRDALRAAVAAVLRSRIGRQLDEGLASELTEAIAGLPEIDELDDWRED